MDALRIPRSRWQAERSGAALRDAFATPSGGGRKDLAATYDLQKCGLLSLLHGTHFAQWSYNVCAMEETALHPLVLGV